MHLIRFFLLLFCVTSINAFAEKEKSSGILSELKQLSTNFIQNEQELLPPDQAFKLTVNCVLIYPLMPTAIMLSSHIQKNGL